jgi:hypothetical protein
MSFIINPYRYGDSYLLTSSGDAEVAYSLRKLSADSIYSGACIRVRRNGDNAEQDISFDGDGIDQTELTDFVTQSGGDPTGGGYIVTWYDQSGSGNNASQSTANSQATIVLSGAAVVDPDNGLISAYYISDWYLYDSGISSSQLMLDYMVFNRITSGGITIFSTQDFNNYTLQWDGSGNIKTSMGSQQTHETSQSQTGDFMLSCLRDSSNEVKLRLNAADLTSKTYADGTQSYVRLNNRGGAQMVGYMQEYVYWAKDKEADLPDIESNVNTHYSIY